MTPRDCWVKINWRDLGPAGNMNRIINATEAQKHGE